MTSERKQPKLGTQIFSSKAEKYNRFRWDYAQKAITAICELTNLSKSSIVADIGAGTGILTLHFLNLVERVFAVEPNCAMRTILMTRVSGNPHCLVSDRTAEDTGIPSEMVDLITVGTAIHWFDPLPTRKEFIRILKPGGWLAILSNENSNPALNQAMEAALDPTWYMSGVDTSSLFSEKKPRSFYFGGSQYIRTSYRFTLYETWEHFFGAWCSLSYAPDEGDPFFLDFEHAAREVFERFSEEDGLIPIHGLTHLVIGQMQI